MSKMAAVVKLRDDGTTRLLLIIDMLRSHVNEHARPHERVVLPSIVDMVRDLVTLLGGSSDGGDDPGLGGRLPHVYRSRS